MRGLMVVSVVLAPSLGFGGTLAAEEAPAATGMFSPAGSAAEARFVHTATPLPDGRVLVVGGSDGHGNDFTSAEVWDPVVASFGPAGSLVAARSGHPATLLDDGRVLVVGGSRGNDGFDVVSSAEVWEPSGG